MPLANAILLDYSIIREGVERGGGEREGLERGAGGGRDRAKAMSVSVLISSATSLLTFAACAQ